MSTKLKTLIVAVITTICMPFLPVSIVCLTLSLNPDVKWNEYSSGELYPKTGLYAYYYNTLWERMDANQYEGKAGSGNYMRILDTLNDDSWKDSIRAGVIKALGFTSSSFLLVLIALTIHVVFEQKLFVIISTLLSAILGFTGGFFCMKARYDYRNNLVKGILPTALDPYKGGYYNPEFEVMKLGYALVHYGEILSITVCCLMIVQCILYIMFADGQWIWRKETAVVPFTNDP